MKIDIEILINEKSERHFLFNIDKDTSVVIPIKSSRLFINLVGEDNLKFFDNLKDLKQYVKNAGIAHSGDAPKPTPECHKFFADG